VAHWQSMRAGRALIAVALLVGLGVVASLGLWVVRRSDRLVGGGAPGGDPPGQVGVAWEAGLLSPSGDRLAVRFPGLAEGGDRPCGAFYIGLVGATLEGLRVTVITIPGPDLAAAAEASGDPAACPDPPTTPRCAEVRLPYPPADRPVYDGVGGTSPPLATAGPDRALCDQLLDG
jgi:hypothetical protein